MKTYNQTNNRTRRFAISPKEMADSIKNSRMRFHEERDNFGVKLDKTTTLLFKKAYDQLEVINTATRTEYEKEKAYIQSDTSRMTPGQSKTYDVSYTNVYGQEINEKLGVEKGQPNDKYYYIDESNPQGPQKNYISESDFNDRLSTSIRNKVKSEFGIGEELYSITAEDGSKLVITDARDDSAKSNSFKDGFRDINMYHIAPDGTKTQLTKEDVQKIVKGNGITKDNINLGKTQKLSLAAKDTKDTFKSLGRGAKAIENSLGDYMGMNTQTRA